MKLGEFKRPTFIFSLALAALVCSSTANAALPTITHTFETEVHEVMATNVNGENRLLLTIDATIGPAGCKASSVLLATDHLNKASRDKIESVALQAFLYSESVVVSVPTEPSQCVEGKPLATNLMLLNASAPF